MLSVFCEHREICSHWEVRGYAGLLPFVQFRALRVEFGAHHLDRISSQQQPEGRVWGFDSPDDDLGAARRITLLVAVTGVVVLSALTGGVGVISDGGERLLQRTAGEISSERTGLHYDDLDAEGGRPPCGARPTSPPGQI